MPQLISPQTVASSRTPVIAHTISVFLTRSVFDWTPGNVVTGTEQEAVTEEPMGILIGSEIWIGYVRPEGARLKIIPEGQPPFYADSVNVRLFTLDGLLPNDQHARYECRIDGECMDANKKLQDILGLPLSEMDGTKWLRAAGRNEAERVRTWQVWKGNVDQLQTHMDDYYLVNQETMQPQHCRTIAAVVRKRGKPALYRGIVLPHESP